MPRQVRAAGVTVRELGTSDGSLVCEVPTPTMTVLYLHGGGYRFGSAALAVPFASRVAAAAGVRVVCAEYRLAPEHPFPAALHDCARVYEHLNDGSIVVLGDSAGGGLGAALSLAARQAQVPLPRAQILLSPWVDLECATATYESRADSDEVFSRSAALDAAAMYCQGHDRRDPLVSPLFADLTGLPPTLLLAAGDEVLLGDSLALAERLALAGAPVQLIVEPGLQHVWPILWPELPQSEQALSVIAAFLTALAT